MALKFTHNQRVTKKKNPFPVVIGVLVIFVLGLGMFNLLARPTQIDRTSVKGVTSDLNLDLERPQIAAPWPDKTQAAIGAVGYGLLAESDPNQAAVPMASLAKVMTAMILIEKHGVEPGEPTENIEISQSDLDLYNEYVAIQGSVVKVEPGKTITLKDAIRAMLIKSANNVADTAAIWSFGSVEEYLVAANQKAQELGMTQTSFADATGFSPESKATASDLIILADYAMRNPFFAETVGTWQTEVFDDQEITNTNLFLDFEGNGVIGLKSGLTDEAKGTYMAAAEYVTNNGDKVIALAVNLGSKTHFSAQEETMPLLLAVEAGFNNPN